MQFGIESLRQQIRPYQKYPWNSGALSRSQSRASAAVDQRDPTSSNQHEITNHVRLKNLALCSVQCTFTTMQETVGKHHMTSHREK